MLIWMEGMDPPPRDPGVGVGGPHRMRYRRKRVLAHRCDWEGRSVLVVHNFSDQPCVVPCAARRCPGGRAASTTCSIERGAIGEIDRAARSHLKLEWLRLPLVPHHDPRPARGSVIPAGPDHAVDGATGCPLVTLPQLSEGLHAPRDRGQHRGLGRQRRGRGVDRHRLPRRRLPQRRADRRSPTRRSRTSSISSTTTSCPKESATFSVAPDRDGSATRLLAGAHRACRRTTTRATATTPSC